MGHPVCTAVYWLWFFAEKFVLISISFIANSSITCCLCFRPCAVAMVAVAHVSQTIRFEISSNRPPTLLFSYTNDYTGLFCDVTVPL